MNCINDPALLAGFSAILMDKVMTGPTKRSKQAVVTKVAPITPRLVMNVLTFRLLAFLTHGMQCQVGFFYLCILLVFTLALGGCIPQPSAAFEAIGPFQWSF